MNRTTGVAAAAALLLTACSGGTSTVPAVGQPAAAPAVMTPAGSAPVTFVVVVPGGGTSSIASRARKPAFISPSTQSVVVSLSGQKLLAMDVSAGSSICKASAKGSRTCTARTSAPSGKQRFAIAAFDAAGGGGNVLASGNVQAKLTAGKATSIHVSLTGKPASIAVSLENPYPPAGKAVKTPVTVAVLDADGNTILGSYGTSVALSDNDTSGATKLSVGHISDSSTGVTLGYDGSTLTQAVISAQAAHVVRETAVFAPSPTSVAQYDAPQLKTRNGELPAGVADLCLGPDGNMWVTAASTGGILKLDPQGKYTSYPILGTQPVGISLGSDRNLWFAEESSGKIAKITTGGKITAYKLPVPAGGSSQPAWTTLGPDGLTWFIDEGSPTARVGNITSAGKITEYSLPKRAFPVEIAAGPDKNLWITDGGFNAIDVVSTSGQVVAIHRLPTANSSPWGITTGPDKNIWFAEFGANRVGRMTTSGKLKEFTAPTAFGGPLNVASGPDGNVWFTETGGGFWDFLGKVGYVTPDGSVIRDFPTGGTVAHAHNLAFDAKGNLWFTKFAGPYSAVQKMVY